ncbi:hypothetical protein SAMN06265370_106216 [Puniceibacterium sediminis]|uniref:Uncharacterized protein n=1 Tax=Puniceibacterium sediminis TaxID=1608407 RepID=A0A238WPC5_9RHOB|nr:hypothetical protein SAMN06265370_106216 [Puniceibacterium sediminis]
MARLFEVGFFVREARRATMKKIKKNFAQTLAVVGSFCVHAAMDRVDVGVLRLILSASHDFDHALVDGEHIALARDVLDQKFGH